MATQPHRGLAVTSLVLGFLALAGSVTIIVAPLGVIAVVTGVVSLRRNSIGRGTAISGIVLGSLGVLISVVVALFLGYLVSESGLNDFSRCVREAHGDPVAAQQCGREFNERLDKRFGPPPTATMTVTISPGAP